MADRIELSPAELLAQSAEMQAIKDEFENLFSQTSGILKNLNSSWSPNLANNFLGKITSAGSASSAIVGLLEKGAMVAKTSAETFQSVDGLIARDILGGDSRAKADAYTAGGGGYSSADGGRGAFGSRWEDTEEKGSFWSDQWQSATYSDINEIQRIIETVFHCDKETLNREAIKKIGEFLRKYAEDGVEGTIVLKTTTNAIEALFSGIKKYAADPSLKNAAEYLWNVTGGAMGSALGEFGYEFWDHVPVVNALMNNTLDKYGGGIEGLSNLTNETLNTIMGDDWTNYYKENGGYFSGVYNGCVEMVNYIKDFGVSGSPVIGEGIVDGIVGFGTGTYNYAKSAYDSVADYCRNFGLGETVEALGQPIVDSVKTFLSDKVKSFNPLSLVD